MYLYTILIIKKTTMKTKVTRNAKTNKIEFYRNGIQVFDFTIKANIVEFKSGEIILL